MLLKIEELGAQGMVDEAQSLMTQVEELEKEKNSYSSRTGSRVCYKAIVMYVYMFKYNILVITQVRGEAEDMDDN